MRALRRTARHGWTLAIAVAVAAVVASATPAAAVNAPSPALTGPEDQLQPSANATYLIWTQNSVSNPARYHAFGKVRGTSDVFRLDEPGTRGYAGGIDPDQDRAIYQQIEGATSDLYTISLANPTSRIKLGPKVNTDRWEWGPRMSNRYILFARDGSVKTSIVLYDRVAKTAKRLVSLDVATYYLAPGGVGERYATWTVCTPTDCNAIVHDTEAGTTRRVPAPVGKGHYAPVVDEAEGQLYFARSGPSCGATVKIMRVPAATPAATPQGLWTLPSGVDVGYQLSIEHASGQVDLWFSRFRCDPGQGDLYRLRDVGVA